jgi:hypothetical protein
MLQIPETRVEVSIEELLGASTRAVELWPDERPPWDPEAR